MEIPYPGGSALIRTALLKQGIPFHSVDTSMASISASTLKSYDASLKKWWYFCQEGELDIYEASIPRIIEFLQLEFNKGLSFSALNGIRSAISLITTADVKDDLRVSRFFRGISKLRPPKPKYDCTWDPKDILDYYDSQQMNEKLDLKCLSEKLLILLAIVTGQRIHTLSLIKIENIRVSKDKIEILIPDPVKTSGINVFQPLLLLPFYRKNLKICPATPLRDYLNVTSQSRGGILKMDGLSSKYMSTSLYFNKGNVDFSLTLTKSSTTKVIGTYEQPKEDDKVTDMMLKDALSFQGTISE
uniref:Tyr recombinase domain-containing protein n=1 Tax=Trichogramma kaykai TaxID=54128 RepID=A0ABD2W069_9HYME